MGTTAIFRTVVDSAITAASGGTVKDVGKAAARGFAVGAFAGLVGDIFGGVEITGDETLKTMTIPPQEMQIDDLLPDSVKNMSQEEIDAFMPDWNIICAPGFMADPEIDGTRQHNFAVLNFSKKMILIGGTGYTGEIKKGIFSVLNFVLPHDRNVLSMHCSANIGENYTLTEAISYLENIMAEIAPNNQVTWKGKSEEIKETSSELLIIFVLALLTAYLVMAATFNSFIHPFIIILTVPLAVFGGLVFISVSYTHLTLPTKA